MNKEPFLQVSKRRNKAGWQERLLIRFIALILALIVCGAVIVALVKMNPVDVYKAIWDGAMGSERRIWQTIRDTMVLLCIAIGLAPAFKMKFWNIGAEGQILIGGACSAAVMIYAGDKMSPVVLLIVMFVASALGGMIWGMIPAVFKAYWNTNETLFTLMLNYVAMQVVTYCIVFWENPKGSNTVGIINQTTQTGWLPELFGQKYGWNVLIVMILTVGMFIYLKYCKQGYEIAVVGESENTAKYAGIHVKKVIIRTMAISGAICGIAGFVIVSGASHTISTATAGGRGFTAIIVAWLSKFNTFIMVAVSFGIVFMNQGAVQIATQYGLNENASDVILGIILFFLIGAEFFINYRVKRAKKEEVDAMSVLIIFIQKAIVQGICILYGALGEIMTEKSGNLNLGIPGIMYMGGIAGLMGAFLYEKDNPDPNAFIGVLISFVCAFACAMIGGLIYSILTITLRVNQNVTGLALTIFGTGFGNFFGGSISKLAGGVGQISVKVTGSAYTAKIPGLSKIPVIGDILFNYGFMTYLCVIAAVVLSFFLFKTRAGLNLRAIGENPGTADAAGINVIKYKYLSTCIGAGLAGLGGLYFVMEYSGGTWTDNGFGDRGWLAVALVIFALWKPLNAIWGAFLFGALYILYLYIPGLGRSMQEVFKALPYVVTIIVLVFTSFRKKKEHQPPAALGLPYFREER